MEANPETLPERVKRIRWFHTIDLGGGIVTPGIEKTTAEKLEYIGLPEDLSGKTVLDVGAWDGFFSFECEVLISKPTWAAGPGAGELHPITAQTAKEWFGEAQSARAGIHAIR